MSAGHDDLWYPTVDDILLIHEDIINEDSEATPGVEEDERIEFAIDYVQHGHFGEVPETIHEKAFHLMRLLASNHWFVDGNKRTALNTTELFYLVNGRELDYGEDIRSMLKLFSVREALIDQQAASEYLKDKTSAVELSVGEYLPDEDERPSLRDEFGLTTSNDGTVNNDGDENNDNDGG